MEEHSLLLRLTATAYYCLNTDAISPDCILTFQKNALFIKFCIEFVTVLCMCCLHRDNTDLISVPQRKILSQAETAGATLTQFCIHSLQRHKFSIPSQSVFMLKAIFTFYLFIYILSEIVTNVPISENKLCINVPSPPVHEPQSQCLRNG